MGCTSSAPNMADIHSNSAENVKEEKTLETYPETKSDELERNIVDNEQSKIVLPLCDNLEDNIQLSRNSSFIKTSAIHQVENVDHVKNIVEQHENSEPHADLSTQNELPALKEVVNQVLSENIFQSIENISTLPDNESGSDENVSIHEKSIEPHDTCEINEDLKENDEQEKILEESISPSQSECSRATRWEALADIAAELPPTLAVDPLTGQIYSLAK
ncbi:uncharacterized protein LOC126774279 [Nymphalis io]|uniref:uncharacterized protein LOC126774279 n=1 Tax=Inachis io TaxID=171585 RepID=UPI00216A9F02|nr:uncharacterized protein LOC126774279 [Nymphalis io]